MDSLPAELSEAHHSWGQGLKASHWARPTLQGKGSHQGVNPRDRDHWSQFEASDNGASGQVKEQSESRARGEVGGGRVWRANVI